jgi:hypothetical protein
MADQDRSPYTRPIWIASAVLILIVILCGVYLFATRKPSTTTAPPPSTPASQPAPSPTDNCNPDNHDQNIPADTPKDVKWAAEGSLFFATSPNAGPLVNDPDGVQRCFAHTPYGALIAANVILARMVFANKWEAVLDNQVVPGPGVEAYRKIRKTVDQAPSPGQLGTPAGWQIVSFDPNVTTVALVQRTSTGQLQRGDVNVRWVNGDWKLAIGIDGSPSTQTTVISSLAGFHAWGP